MYSKTLVLSALTALAMATPEVVDKRQANLESQPSAYVESQPSAYVESQQSAALATLASLAGVQTTDPVVVHSLLDAAVQLDEAATVPASISKMLVTGIPSSVQAALLEDPQLLATATVTPEWFSSLPSGAQSYLSSEGSVINSMISSFGFTHTSGLRPVTTTDRPHNSSTTTSGANSTSPTTSPSSTTTAGAFANSSSLSSSSSSRSSSAASASSSSNPGSKPTGGAMAASLAGLVGVIGVAVIL